jgi:hypothetical protein
MLELRFPAPPLSFQKFFNKKTLFFLCELGVFARNILAV